MTPLARPLGTGEFVLWRLDQLRFGSTWDSGEGSYLAGGRWSSRGHRAVYAALDPATAILEVAVHATFATLDTIPHVLTRARLLDIARIHIVDAAAIPNPNWLLPGSASRGQQAFGDDLLRTHPFLLIPSVVSTHSWNVIFDPARAAGFYNAVVQERFALDTRLHPPGGG